MTSLDGHGLYCSLEIANGWPADEYVRGFCWLLSEGNDTIRADSDVEADNYLLTLGIEGARDLMVSEGEPS